jgi:hypothetical protein
LEMNCLSFPLRSCWARFTEVRLLAVHSVLMSSTKPGRSRTRDKTWLEKGR